MPTEVALNCGKPASQSDGREGERTERARTRITYSLYVWCAGSYDYQPDEKASTRMKNKL